jgi:hypothetical protein
MNRLPTGSIRGAAEDGFELVCHPSYTLRRQHAKSCHDVSADVAGTHADGSASVTGLRLWNADVVSLPRLLSGVYEIMR